MRNSSKRSVEGGLRVAGAHSCAHVVPSRCRSNSTPCGYETEPHFMCAPSADGSLEPGRNIRQRGGVPLRLA
eukprot:4093029-Alexandrium_andersonii.AAC.1